MLFPLLAYHNIYFLTMTRRAQFERAMYILLNNIVRYADIPLEVPQLYPLPLTPVEYGLLPFFANWIVGFTIFCFSKKNNTRIFLCEKYWRIFL